MSNKYHVENKTTPNNSLTPQKFSLSQIDKNIIDMNSNLNNICVEYVNEKTEEKLKSKCKCKHNCNHFNFLYENAIHLPLSPFYVDKKYADIRRIKLILISDQLGKYNSFKKLNYKQKIKIIAIIENSCLNESIRKANEYGVRSVWDNEHFVNIYHSICYNISTNIDHESGDESATILMEKIINGGINLHKIASMTCKQLCPEKYAEIDREIKQRNNTERKVKYSEMYFCFKCKKNKVTVGKRFNRSLDEGVNLMINCLFCGNSWCA